MEAGKDEDVALQREEESATAQAVDLTEDPQAAPLWATRFIEPADSAGHDEVVYVGTGGQPVRQPSRAEQETQQAIDAQVKELNAAEQKKKLQQLLGPEEAARYSRFKEEERHQQEQAV